MAYRDREGFVAALDAAKGRIKAAQAQISAHVAGGEVEVAKMRLTDLADALTKANPLANQFADKFGG